MKTLKSFLFVAATSAVLMGCTKPAEQDAKTEVVNTASSESGSTGMTIDDFSDPAKTSFGIDRLFIDDKTGGGQTTTLHSVENGVLSVKGELVPARGQPGWSSIALPLVAEGLSHDASAYEGIRILLRVNQGNLSISANSTEITNFDYHASTVTPASDGEFHEIKIPFTEMKRAWSAQTKLNTKTLGSLSLVAFGLQEGPFDFEFDEVGFY